jgi:transcriptional regulator with XRE-family HTH domain
MDDTRQDLARFGNIVKRRREQLDLQQEDMRHHGGPSSTTMSEIERGLARIHPSTLRKLDAGLRWAKGSAAKTLDGGEPEELPEQTTGLEAVDIEVLLGEIRRRVLVASDDPQRRNGLSRVEAHNTREVIGLKDADHA